MRVCTSCGQVWLRAFPDQLHLLTTPQTPKADLGILDKVWACLGRERRAEEIWGGRGKVLNSLSLERPKRLRISLEHQV